jgi:hypothetical protein
VPRNTGFPRMTLPFNRSLVGARVKRISSARAPEMCPLSKTIRENQTVRETFQGFANPTGQRPGAQVPVPPQLPCVRCWRWPRRCWRARSPIAAASTTRPSTVFRVGPPCSGQQRTGTPALGKPRKRCPSDGGPRVRIHFPPGESRVRTSRRPFWGEVLPGSSHRRPPRNGRDQIGINGRPSEYEDALPVQREADTSGPGMDTEKTNGDPAPPAITSFSPARNRTSSVQK